MSSEDEKRRERERRNKIKREINKKKDDREEYENKVKKLEDDSKKLEGENQKLKETNENLNKANVLANENIKYQDIQTKIESVIDALNDAKNNLADSLRKYNENFTGKAASIGVSKYSSVNGLIDDVIDELNTILTDKSNGVIAQMQNNDDLINRYISKSVASFRRKI